MRLDRRAIAAALLVWVCGLSGCAEDIFHPETGTTYLAVTAGGAHTCALDADGRAWCWGSNSHGQIGVAPRHRVLGTPVAVNGSTRFRTLSAGDRHTCGIAQDGRAWCWGANESGQLGDGSRTDRDAPRPVMLPTTVVRIAAGFSSSCVTDASGGLWCWGANDQGQIGPGASSTFPRSLESPALISGIAVGRGHGCAIGASGAFCWGENASGQLGAATLEDSPVPVRISTFEVMHTVASGRAHSCALTSTQDVRCWGANDRGQLAQPINPRPFGTPVAVRGLPGGLTAVATAPGGDLTCAARPRAVWCWGGIDELRMGSVLTLPAPIEGLPAGQVTGIAVGDRHACALLAGVVACWGAGESGQLGDGRRESSALPVRPLSG